MNTKKVFEISCVVDQETKTTLIVAEKMSAAVEFVELNIGPVMYCNIVSDGAPVTIV